MKVLAAAYKFPSLQQVAYVRRTYWNGDETVSEGRIFLTSIPRNRLSAKRFLAKITGHWEVENSLHNVKDKHWNEDKQFTCRVSLGCLQAALRNLSLNLLRVVEVPWYRGARSLTGKALQLLAQPIKALGWLSKA